jgi:hypothetical protein
MGLAVSDKVAFVTESTAGMGYEVAAMIVYVYSARSSPRMAQLSASTATWSDPLRDRNDREVMS